MSLDNFVNQVSELAKREGVAYALAAAPLVGTDYYVSFYGPPATYIGLAEMVYTEARCTYIERRKKVKHEPETK